jgi:uncharacterized protein DUF3617
MLTRYLLILAATCGTCAVGSAADFPMRKPGLWQITMSPSNPKYPPRVEKVCLDAATDQLLYKVGAGGSQKMCSKIDIHSAGGKVIVDSQCDFGGSKLTSHGVTTMTGDTAYRTDINLHYDPPMFGKSDSTSTQEAKWIGACPADMKPGDIVVDASSMMPAPMKMNLNDIFKGSQ